MTFRELLQRGGLPDGVSAAMVDAADRQARGEKLGPRARRSAARLIAKLDAERRDRQREDWGAHDQHLRDGERTSGPPSPRTARPAPASPASPAHPGAARLSAPRQPTPSAGTTGPGAGGGGALHRSAFDARTASFEDLQVRLGQLGISAPYMENRPQSQPRPRAMGLGVTIKQRKIENEAEARRVQREKDLAATAVDARGADAETVRRRLDQLQIDPELQRSVREVPKPLPPREEFNPLAASLEARRKAERRARAAAKSGRPVDARSMPGDILSAYMRLRGWSPPAGW